MAPPTEAEVFTPPEVAKRHRVSPEKIIHFIESGELAAINIATNLGGRPRYRVPRDALEAFELLRAVSPAPARRSKPRSERLVRNFR